MKSMAGGKDRLGYAGNKLASGIDVLKNIFWVLFIGSFLWGMLSTKLINSERQKVIHQIEKERGSKVITMIHRQETVGFFGVPLKKYIQMEDAEAILRTIREIPDDKPIDLIVHTPGGMLLPAYQIARALKNHKGKVTVFVPHYAMSGGTLIALAADEIVMDRNAVLGPIDPQLSTGHGTMPAVSILKIPKHKDWEDIDDQVVVLYDQASKIVKQMKQYVRTLVDDKNQGMADKIISRLVKGQVTHDYPVFFDEAKKLGLPVSDEMPGLVYRLMDLYPQPYNKKF